MADLGSDLHFEMLTVHVPSLAVSTSTPYVGSRTAPASKKLPWSQLSPPNPCQLVVNADKRMDVT
jgi:hypothetical protein